jgi:hypothetical protein
MQPVKIDVFGGLFPRYPDTALPPTGATEAQNIDFSYANQLVSLKGDFNLKTLPFAVQSIWSEDGLRFYSWANDADAVISPLGSGLANDRLYYTSLTEGFRVTPRSLATVFATEPVSYYAVGVPRPTIAPVVTVVPPVMPTGAAATAADLQVEADKATAVPAAPANTYAARLQAVTDQSTADLAAAQATRDALVQANAQVYTETRAYVYTYANTNNEEGPPSDATVVNVTTISYNNATTYTTVTVQVNFDGYGSYVPINQARVYHTSTGTTTSDYYYALTVNGSTGAVTVPDTSTATTVSTPLAYYDAYPPPANLQGLIYVGNGILAAWTGNQMWFSDAYRPWSWPPSYMIVFKNAVVGAAACGTGALVTTVGKPVMVSGISPDAMSQTMLDIQQAGVSKWSILNAQGSLIYASHDGIVVVTGGQCDMSLSERFFTRETWRARCNNSLSDMVLAYYDGRLVIFSKSNAFTAFMITLDEVAGNMTDLPNLIAQTTAVLVTSDQMYTINGTQMNQFGGGSDSIVKWQSDDHIFPDPTIFTIAQAECIGNFTVNFYQYGVLGYSQALTTGQTTFRLPSGPCNGYPGLPICDRWKIEIIGTGTFKRLKMAQSGRGLKDV